MKLIRDIDKDDESINDEIDNAQHYAEQNIYTESDEISDIDTTDIEEAKSIIFQKALNKQTREKNNAIGSDIDDLSIKDTPKPQGGGVSGKSFMVIKQMLKDK